MGHFSCTLHMTSWTNTITFIQFIAPWRRRSSHLHCSPNPGTTWDGKRCFFERRRVQQSSNNSTAEKKQQQQRREEAKKRRNSRQQGPRTLGRHLGNNEELCGTGKRRTKSTRGVQFIDRHMTVANIPKPPFLRVKLEFRLPISYIQLCSSDRWCHGPKMGLQNSFHII